jgi:hypothetical protein
MVLNKWARSSAVEQTPLKRLADGSNPSGLTREDIITSNNKNTHLTFFVCKELITLVKNKYNNSIAKWAKMIMS